MALLYGLCLSYPNAVSLFLASVLALLAFLSDLLDGYWARKRNIVSYFGICFDPIADKIFTLCAFAMLMTFESLNIPMFPFLLIIIREMGISGIRVLLLSSNQILLPAERYGKVKSALQFGLIFIFTAGLWIELVSKIDVPFLSYLLRPPSSVIAFWLVALYTFSSSWAHIWRHRKALIMAWEGGGVKQRPTA